MLNNQSEVATSVMLKSIEIAYVAPQVIAHRVSQMVLAGPLPSIRDRKEFHLMGTEKLLAAIESWNAMALGTGLILQVLAIKNLVSLMAPWPHAEFAQLATTNQLSIAAISILSKGVAPIHRRVMANAKRFEYAGRH